MAKKEKVELVNNLCSVRINDDTKNRIKKIEEVTNMKFPLSTIMRNAILNELNNLEKLFDVIKTK